MTERKNVQHRRIKPIGGCFGYLVVNYQVPGRILVWRYNQAGVIDNATALNSAERQGFILGVAKESHLDSGRVALRVATASEPHKRKTKDAILELRVFLGIKAITYNRIFSARHVLPPNSFPLPC